jgi:hypothetical protein
MTEKPVCHLYTVFHLLRLVVRYAWSWVCKWGPHKCLGILSMLSVSEVWKNQLYLSLYSTQVLWYSPVITWGPVMDPSKLPKGSVTNQVTKHMQLVASFPPQHAAHNAVLFHVLCYIGCYITQTCFCLCLGLYQGTYVVSEWVCLGVCVSATSFTTFSILIRQNTHRQRKVKRVKRKERKTSELRRL